MFSKGIDIGSNRDLEDKLTRVAAKRGAVSAIYKIMLAAAPDSNSLTKLQWEGEISIPITNTQWDAALKNSSKISKCIRYKILQLKIIHRAYITLI